MRGQPTILSAPTTVTDAALNDGPQVTTLHADPPNALSSSKSSTSPAVLRQKSGLGTAAVSKSLQDSTKSMLLVPCDVIIFYNQLYYKNNKYIHLCDGARSNDICATEQNISAPPLQTAPPIRRQLLGRQDFTAQVLFGAHPFSDSRFGTNYLQC